MDVNSVSVRGEDETPKHVNAVIDEEHINVFRLRLTLTTICRKALRKILLTHIPVPFVDIYQVLLANKTSLMRRLNKAQFRLVFPDPHGRYTGTVDTFDLTLLYTLIRNFSTVLPPVTAWGSPPNNDPRDRCLGASVERIRQLRNIISLEDIDGKTTQKKSEHYWIEIENILLDIENSIGYQGFLVKLEQLKNQVIISPASLAEQKTFQEYKVDLEKVDVNSVSARGEDETPKHVNAVIDEEHINVFRLRLTLTTICRKALRKILLTHIPVPFVDIYQALLANKASLMRRLNKAQFRLVFPDPHGRYTGTVDTFDLTLLYTLIRNFSTVLPPVTAWGNPTYNNPRDRCLGASVERIRQLRNIIDLKDIDGKTTQKKSEHYWIEIENILLDIENSIGYQGFLVKLEQLKSQVIISPASLAEQKTFQEYKEDLENKALPDNVLQMDDQSIELYKEALKNGKEKVYRIRVMVVGDFGVGKTTLIKRLLRQNVDISERKVTEGIEIHVDCCNVSLDTGKWTLPPQDADLRRRLQRLVNILNEEACKTNSDDKKDREESGVNKLGYYGDVADTDSANEEEEVDQEMSPDTDRTDVGVISTRQNESSKNDITDLTTLSRSNVIISEKVDSRTERHKDYKISTEILKLLRKNKEKLKEGMGNCAQLSMWDFAGQNIFYTTHQTFLTQNAIYLLVSDASKDAKIYDNADLWLNSIHSCAPSHDSGIPPVILVGTHVDKIIQDSPEDICKNYFTNIRRHLEDKPIKYHIADESFAISNKFEDPRMEDLRKKINQLASKQPYWGHEIPATWFHLEEMLIQLKTSGIKVIPYRLLEQMNQEQPVKIKSQEELDSFLKLQHNIGAILYFSVPILRKNIVLDPKCLINGLSSLITAEMFILEKCPKVSSKWREFEQSGRLTLDLIDAVWTEHNPELANCKEHIILLMEHLNIIAKPRSVSDDGNEISVEEFFLAPCMLRQIEKTEVISSHPDPSMKTSSVLSFVFTGKYLPPTIFHRLLVTCVACWPIAKKKNKDLIYSDHCVFKIDQLHRLTLHLSCHVIFARVIGMVTSNKDPNWKLCIRIRKFLEKNLQDIIGYLGPNLEFKYFIQCPRSDDVYCIESLIPREELEDHGSHICEFHENHPVDWQELGTFWFEDEGIKEENLANLMYVMRFAVSSLSLDKQDLQPSNEFLSLFSFKIRGSPLFLGLELKIEQATIYQIQDDYKFISTQYLVMLIKWRDESKTPATLKKLEEALRSIGEDPGILESICTTGTADPVYCFPENKLDEQVSERHLDRISAKIGKEFIHLGVVLGISLQRIEQIQLEEPHSVREQCYEILKLWRQKMAREATFRSLEKAFGNAGISAHILTNAMND